MLSSTCGKNIVWDANAWDMGNDIADFDAFRAHIRCEIEMYALMGAQDRDPMYFHKKHVSPRY
jgi:hypothetical protein